MQNSSHSAGNVCYTPCAMTKKSEPLTKDDVEKIVNRVVTRVVNEVVSEVVGEVADNILTSVAESFEQHRKETAAGFNRIENILRPNTDKLDDHEVRLKRLEAQAA